METKNIRNIALMGHGNSGKTSLAESMLYITGAVDRLGKVADGNQVSGHRAVLRVDFHLPFRCSDQLRRPQGQRA